MEHYSTFFVPTCSSGLNYSRELKVIRPPNHKPSLVILKCCPNPHF